MPSISELRTICQKSVPELDNYPLLFKAIRVVSIYLTWILIKTPLTPNLITLLGIFSAFLGLLSFVFGWHALGVAFFIFCVISDFSDGEVSRYKNLRTREGTYLDKIHHFYSNAIFFVALSLLFFHETADLVFLYAGIIIVPFSILLPFTVTYAIDVAVLTHIRYYIKKSKHMVSIDVGKVDKSSLDLSPENKMPIKTSFAIFRQVVALSRYWGFPHLFVVFGIVAVIDAAFLENTYTLARSAFIFYAFSYPIWAIAFLTRVLSKRIINREVEYLIRLIMEDNKQEPF